LKAVLKSWNFVFEIGCVVRGKGRGVIIGGLGEKYEFVEHNRCLIGDERHGG
jgi:hypothetical protein